MRKVEFTDGFKKQSSKLCRKNPSLRKKLAKQFELFSTNISHPSLKFHKLKGKRSIQYAMWIEDDLRAVAIKEKNTYIFFELTSHDEY